MKQIELNVNTHGFRGTLYDPENKSDKVIIVFLGSEGSFLPAGTIAERFSDLGYPSLALYYFGGKDLPKIRAQIPMELVGKALIFLKEYENGRIKKIGTYGISLGSMLALISGVLFEEISCVIAVSPTHVVTEGFISKTKLTNNSFLTYRGKDIPYLSLPPHMKMYQMFEEAYKARDCGIIPIERIKGRILLVASNMDESWPASYSVKSMETRLIENKFNYPYKTILFEKSSHLTGITPDVKKHRFVPLLLLAFRQERKCPKECNTARKQAETEITKWLSEW